MSNVYPFLPKLTVNGQFIRDFIAAESPCFALGLVEERKQQCGFLALRADEVIFKDQQRRIPNMRERWRNFGDTPILRVKYSTGSAATTSTTWISLRIALK